MSQSSKIRLSEEGFSYHTIELKYRMRPEEYEALLSKLYKTGTVHKLAYSEVKSHNCRFFQKNGINLYFTKTNKNYRVVKAVVNPRRVLEPESGYLGTMPVDLVKQMKFEEKFNKLMREAELPSFEGWELTRVDLCVNLECEFKETASEILRVLNKKFLPPKMERKRFLKENADKEERREQRKKDRHSIRVVLKNGLSLTVYDKLFQLESEKLPVTPKKHYMGILRVEVKCDKECLKTVGRHIRGGNTELLRFLVTRSASVIIGVVTQVYGSGELIKAKSIKSFIDESGYQEQTKEQLKWMVDRIGRDFNPKKLVKDMEKRFGITPRVVQNRIEMLRLLPCDPIPLRSDFYLERMPSLSTLLSSLAKLNGRIVLSENGGIILIFN